MTETVNVEPAAAAAEAETAVAAETPAAAATPASKPKPVPFWKRLLGKS